VNRNYGKTIELTFELETKLPKEGYLKLTTPSTTLIPLSVGIGEAFYYTINSETCSSDATPIPQIAIDIEQEGASRIYWINGFKNDDGDLIDLEP